MEDFLQKFHERFPGCTSTCMASGRTEMGLSSYEHLAKTVGSPAVLLDLACGDGYFLSLVPASVRRIGLDMSEAELRLAAERPGLELIHGNGREIPLSTASVDQVTCHMAFMLFTGVEQVVAEILRVLKPGGTFSAVIPHPSPKGFEPDLATKIYFDVRTGALAEEGLEPTKIGESATKSREGINQLMGGFREATFQEFTVKYEMNLEEAVRYFSLLYTPGQLSAAGFNRFQEELRMRYSDLPMPIAARLPILCWSAVK